MFCLSNVVFNVQAQVNSLKVYSLKYPLSPMEIIQKTALAFNIKPSLRIIYILYLYIGETHECYD